MKKALAIIVFFLLSGAAFGQLANFSLQVTATNETCSGNGSLSFSVSGTTPGSTIIYSIYRLPDTTTPIAVTASASFTGLVGGNYSVVATQSLGSESNTQQQEITILSQVIPVQYSLIPRNVVCGNDGEISVSVTQGTAVTYEIISGPLIFPPQPSNVFSGLTIGTYTVRVFDACGDGIVRDITITRPSIPNLITGAITLDNLTCNTIEAAVAISSGTLDFQNIIAYPLTIETTIFPPAGGPIVLNETMAGGNVIDDMVLVELPFYYDQLYTYDIKITDACGNVYQDQNNNVNVRMSLSVHESLESCGKKMVVNPANFVAPFTITFLSSPPGFDPLQFNGGHPGPFTESVNYYNAASAYPEGTYVVQVTDACGRSASYSYTTVLLPLDFSVTESLDGCFKEMIIQVGSGVSFTVEFLSAPSGFDPLLFNPMHPGPFPGVVLYHNDTMDYPEGTYVIKLTDECGRTAIKTYETNPVELPFTVFLLPGCSLGEGSVLMTIPAAYQSVSIITAPAGFGQALPYDVSQFIHDEPQYFSMNTLPEGNYTFQSVDTCNRTRTDNVMVLGYRIFAEEITVTQHCSSFDIYLNYDTNSSGNNFWLQRFDPVNNTWGNPQTGFSDGLPANMQNALLLTNHVNNVNFNYMGRFRIVHTFNIFGSGFSDGLCEDVIHEFEYATGPKIANIYSFSCSDSLYDVIVSASGVAPLQYRITTRNGVPFSVDNLTASLFEGLQPGIYNFQVEDACGNILNRLYDINAPVSFAIAATENLCNGTTGALYVPDFSFLSYEWWHESNPGAILSTASTLEFTPFNSPGDYGTYHVRITNTTNPNSCMEMVLDFTISDDLNTPEAGVGATTVLCGPQATINLFDYLAGNDDTVGSWEELSFSGMLLNHFWNATSVSSGVYRFRYRVNGLCGFYDDAFVQLEINEVPESPVASGDIFVCEGQSLHLFASDIPGVTYQWTGPNGFLSNEQNPLLANFSNSNQGTYTVSAFQNGCESGISTVDVVLGKMPDFTIRNHCENNRNYLTAEILDASDPASLYYEWVGPNGALLTGNPINITGNEGGSYTLTVTNSDGCFAAKSIDVFCTQCGIPRGVSPNSDMLNDTFDLSCLEGVVHAKIFNRYGMTVYELDNYVNEWKGQDFKGRLLPTGTYYYLIKFDSGESKTGWVYLNY